MGSALPLLFREAGILFSFREHSVVDLLHCGVDVTRSGDADGDFIPHPLAGGREVEVLTADRITIHKGNAATGRMTFVFQGPCLKQRCEK